VAKVRPSAARHVLVVNDTEEIIELMRDVVEGLGHRVTATTYAPEDLAKVVEIGPDLAILDLRMGGNDNAAGWDLLQKMKLSRQTEHIPVIVCTAATDQVREQEGWLASKGVKIVLKPFSVDDLELAINKAFALPDILPASDGTSPAQEAQKPN
jgi:CheY-like chemotaxis protein